MKFNEVEKMLIEIIESIFENKMKLGVIDTLNFFKKQSLKLFKQKKTILIIDELEGIFNKDKNIQWILDFLNFYHPNFIKICISNTLNLFVKESKIKIGLNFT